jgi:riboflavin kinase
LLTAGARPGGLDRFVDTSSGDLADTLGVSQQTASRYILDVVEQGLLDRRMVSRGQRLRLTESGRDALASELEELKAIFEPEQTVAIEGRIAEGDGEGAYYMKQPFYKEGFEELLGFTPYPGTLNVEVDPGDLDLLEVLRNRDALEIPKVETSERVFGGVTGYPATVMGVEVGVIFPHRTRHERVLEVIAPDRLRDELDLETGQRLEVRVNAHPEGTRYDPRDALLE